MVQKASDVYVFPPCANTARLSAKSYAITFEGPGKQCLDHPRIIDFRYMHTGHLGQESREAVVNNLDINDLHKINAINAVYILI